MVDTWAIVGLIVGVVAIIIAIVAMILVFVQAGPKGPTGPTGSTNTDDFMKNVGLLTATSDSTAATTVSFTPGTAVTVRMPYPNIITTYNMVAATNAYTLTSDATGYYRITSENLVDVTLKEVGQATLYLNLMVNGQSIAQSTQRVYFGSDSLTSLSMLSLNWQGQLTAGETVSINLVVYSPYSGTMSYSFDNNTRLMIMGTTI